MDRNKWMIAAAAALLVLCSGTYAYGYWVDRMDASWNLAFSYPVHIQVDSEQEETVEIPTESVNQTLLGDLAGGGGE